MADFYEVQHALKVIDDILLDDYLLVNEDITEELIESIFDHNVTEQELEEYEILQRISR